MALAMHAAFKGRGLLRTVVLVPWAVLTVVSAITWRTLFEPNLGLAPTVLGKLGIAENVVWLGQSGYAMAVMVLADVWKTAPFMALLLLAGLQVIPDDVYDAAKVDGATAWQRFRRITLPLLVPAILVALIFRTLDALRIFDLPFVLTGGTNGTSTLSLIAQQELTTNNLIGYGSALAVLDVRDRDGGLVPVHQDGRRKHPIAGGGRLMEAHAMERVAAEPRAAERRAPRRKWVRPVLMWLVVVAIFIFCLFPFYWLINVSLKTGPDLAQSDLFPPSPTLDNYDSIFKNGDFTSALRNSVIVTSITTVLALIVGSFAAYALARLRFPNKFLLLAVILSISTFPPIAIAAPIFKLWTDIGFYDTYIGLILPYLTFALPLAIYILTSFFKEIPKSLEEAALVDGATYFQAFRKVVLPLAAPGLVTAGLLTAFFVWNEFLLAQTLTSSPKAYTVPVAVANFTGSQKFEIPLGTISAASVVITIPLVAAVIIFQKRIVAGMTAGAVKG